MYVAMTHFKVILGQELLFETIWKERESYLAQMRGYRGLFLMRGETKKDHTAYVSQFIWSTQADFEAWTQSEEFIKAHTQFGQTDLFFKEKPVFEGFTVVLQETAHKAKTN